MFGGLSAGQLPPATKHWVTSFHSTAHCTPGHQNLYAPTNKFSWTACQVSDLDVGCVALAKPWVLTFTKLVPGCAQQHHPLPLPSPWHRRAAWFVSFGHCASFGGGGCAGWACADWCDELWWESGKPRGFAPWLGLRQECMFAWRASRWFGRYQNFGGGEWAMFVVWVWLWVCVWFSMSSLHASGCCRRDFPQGLLFWWRCLQCRRRWWLTF